MIFKEALDAFYALKKPQRKLTIFSIFFNI